MEKLNNIFKSIKRIPENPILTASLVLLGASLVVFSLSFDYYLSDPEQFKEAILAEAHGMLFDLAVIGILIYWLNQKGEERQRIKTYKDEIDDFRLWESDEAAFRTVGNIKRLNRHKIYNINLVNTHLARTNLNYVSLKESNLNNSNLSSAKLIESNLENARLNQTNFENANLNQANLMKAYASGANFKDGFLIKANLQGAFLIKADFTNAFLMEADLRNAYLTGADFSQANLYKADLRGAIGLNIEQFKDVKSLFLAKFDKELEDQLNEHYPELIGK
ncbi:pentapeptide repeat-containing protein [Marinigracilibium pacificum]|uniref:Pentapeptide repeat-containing protein n=1 Tax=Marinigracilibium pacificum TaxID=2729599 RepID=A0A848J8H0_9BACT|nr:pentapeptide repeat-containing protein [Marinigracilibium pacificum]NMM50724.1 pentapeptide repeat-containing protein [Marinigracilibium pacificum]